MVSFSLPDDAELLKRISIGDQRAFETFYHTYSKKIYFFAYKLLQSEYLAEEVVQEVMLKIWNMGEALQKIDNLEAYLRTSSRNLSLNLLRRQEIAQRADRYLQNFWEEGHNETEELVLLNDTKKSIDEAVSKLPAQQKEVYKRCHQQGLKYDEVASQMGLAPSTVATHMKLALKFLRSHLQKNAGLAVLGILFKLF